MARIIIISTFIIAYTYSFIASKKTFNNKTSLLTGFLYSLISTLIVCLLFYITYTSEYVKFILLLIILIFLVLLEFSKNENSTLNYQNYLRVNINTVLISLVYNVLWIHIIRDLSEYHYLLELLFLFIGIAIYIGIQYIYSKSKYSKTNEYQLHIAKVIVTLVIAAFMFYSHIDFSDDLSEYFQVENTIIDQKLKVESLDSIKLDYYDKAILYKNYIYYVTNSDGEELHVYDTSNETDTVLIEKSELNNLDDGFIDIVGLSGGSYIYVHTPLGLYSLDGTTMNALYERDISPEEVQYLDYYSSFYKEWSVNGWYFVFETETGRYNVNPRTNAFELSSESYDPNEIIKWGYKEETFDYEYKFSIGGMRVQVLVEDSEIKLVMIESQSIDINTQDIAEVRFDVIKNIYSNDYQIYEYHEEEDFYIYGDYLLLFNNNEYILNNSDKKGLLLVDTSINYLSTDYDQAYTAYELDGYLYVPYIKYIYDRDVSGFEINTCKISPDIYSFSNLITYSIQSTYYFGFIWLLMPLQVSNKKNTNHV